jgi:hypothetical protein
MPRGYYEYLMGRMGTQRMHARRSSVVRLRNTQPQCRQRGLASLTYPSSQLMQMPAARVAALISRPPQDRQGPTLVSGRRNR